MKCPINDKDCKGRKCAWWVQKMRTAYSSERKRTEVTDIESEGCAVAYIAAKGGGYWTLNGGPQ